MMGFNEHSNLGVLLENKQALEILEKHLPGISTNSMISMAKGLSLKQIASLPQAQISQQTLAAIVSDLAYVSDAGEAESIRKQSISSEKSVDHTESETSITAIVTGGGSGIGRASAIKLSQAGYRLVIVDYNSDTGEETVKLIHELGNEAIFIKADVSNNEDVENYVQRTLEAYGRIDVFFNNAGILQKFSMLTDIELSEYERIMNVNVKGAFLGLKHVLRIMEHQGSGSIINTASTAGLRAEHSMAAYTTSKHAVIGLTKAAALEYVRKGIRVNAICPGGVDTALTQAVPAMMQESGYMPEEFPNMRIGRFASPDEIADTVVFLASAKSSYMTGSIIAVDGGLTL